MKRFTCCPLENIPDELEPGLEYFSLYSSYKPRRANVGHIAIQLQRDIRRAGIEVSSLAWDFASIALSVVAADSACSRSNSADGWTRQIEVNIYLQDPLIWYSQKTNLEQTFRFLTGDFWKLNFLPGGSGPPRPNRSQLRRYDSDCVSLVSGGVDSLVGAIDLSSSGEQPIFISRIVTGDKEIQNQIAERLGATERHFQWSFTSPSPNERETSSRGRSLIFFAYAILAASALESSDEPVPIYVPENGFISLNIALTPSRLGSLSTKTTHPIYLKGLQNVLDAVGINARLVFPLGYQYKTKGEIIEGCLDPDLLLDLVPNSTSCGKYGRHKKTHCGRCVPCLVRRAAFLRAGIDDPTSPSTAFGRPYVFMDLSRALSEKSSQDIRAAASAYLRYKQQGINSLIRGGLSFASSQERNQYKGVVERGIEEIGQLLIHHGVI